jgi:hypothetical protein
METMGATDQELHELVKLKLNDKKDEAERLMADIVRRDTETFRRVVKEELSEVIKTSERHHRRLARLAMITGILAGIFVAGTVMYVRREFFGINTGIAQGAFLAVTCAAFGAYAGWRRAK